MCVISAARSERSSTGNPSEIISAVMKHRCERENEVIAGGVNSPFVFSVFIA